MSRPPRHLADLGLAERREAVAALGERAFRADQLSRHYFARYTDSPEDMTDLPVGVRNALAEELLPRLLTSEREQACDDGATRKMLWRLHDGALVESVLMKYTDRVTMCVSSQAGCGMGCGAASEARACRDCASVSEAAEGMCVIPSSARAWCETGSNAASGEDPLAALGLGVNSRGSNCRLRDG